MTVRANRFKKKYQTRLKGRRRRYRTGNHWQRGPGRYAHR